MIRKKSVLERSVPRRTAAEKISTPETTRCGYASAVRSGPTDFGYESVSQKTHAANETVTASGTRLSRFNASGLPSAAEITSKTEMAKARMYQFAGHVAKISSARLDGATSMFLKMTGLPILVRTIATMTPKHAATIGSRLLVAGAMSELQPQETHFERERFLGVGVKNLLRFVDELEIFHRVRLFQARRDLLAG